MIFLQPQRLKNAFLVKKLKKIICMDIQLLAKNIFQCYILCFGCVIEQL